MDIAQAQWSKINNFVWKFSYFRVFLRLFLLTNLALYWPKTWKWFFKNESYIFLTSTPLKLSKCLSFPKQFLNEVLNFGSLCRTLYQRLPCGHFKFTPFSSFCFGFWSSYQITWVFGSSWCAVRSWTKVSLKTLKIRLIQLYNALEGGQNFHLNQE